MAEDLKTNALHYSSKPKMSIKLEAQLMDKDDLSLAYTPGIAEVCKAIQEDEEVMFTHTFRRNNLAVISNGTAVLGLGKIGHKAGYPVMEGKSMLFKRFAGIDAIPIIVKTEDVDEFVATVVQIADSFGAINLEDIAAPQCFEIEEQLKELLPIPVMHDDQHGTAIVVLAAVLNALKLLPKRDKQTKIVVNGTGAAGVGVIKLLHRYGFEQILGCDSVGVISKDRSDLNKSKQEILEITNPENISGNLRDVLRDADIFIGVSKGNLLNAQDIQLMAAKPIVIAMANPVPEILPDLALEAGASVVATGRSDYANQVNNALAFPGVFKGAMRARAKITEAMKLAAAEAIVEYHQESLELKNLMPSILDQGIHDFIAERVFAAVEK